MLSRTQWFLAYLPLLEAHTHITSPHATPQLSSSASVSTLLSLVISCSTFRFAVLILGICRRRGVMRWFGRNWDRTRHWRRCWHVLVFGLSICIFSELSWWREDWYVSILCMDLFDATMIALYPSINFNQKLENSSERLVCLGMTDFVWGLADFFLFSVTVVAGWRGRTSTMRPQDCSPVSQESI